jgi:hypothetical protein
MNRKDKNTDKAGPKEEFRDGTKRDLLEMVQAMLPESVTVNMQHGTLHVGLGNEDGPLDGGAKNLAQMEDMTRLQLHVALAYLLTAASVVEEAIERR